MPVIKKCPLAKGAQTHPSLIAIDTVEKKFTYKECNQIVNLYCAYLKSHGVHRNQKIALIMEISSSTILMMWALFRLQAKVCLISPKDPPNLTLKHLERLNPSLVLSQELLAFLPTTLSTLSFTSLPKSPYLLMTPSKLKLHSISTLTLTSGSTGEPKIVCHSLSQHFKSATSCSKVLNLHKQDRYHLSIPIHHVGGLAIIFRSFLQGATLVITPMPKLGITAWLHEHSITHLSLVTTQLKRLIDEKQIASPYLKMIALGGSSFPEDYLKEALLLKFPLIKTYALTEMASSVTMHSLNQINSQQTLDKEVFYQSSGKLLPLRKVKINEDGEILVKGSTLFKGYYTKSTPTCTTTTWHATGDLGKWDHDHLIIQGRKHRLMISGGENIYPEEIETLLLSLALVDKAAVIAVDDPLFGRVPIAFIQSSSFKQALTLAEKLLKEELPKYKIPKKILNWPKELESSSLKVTKEDLTALSHHYESILSLS